MGIKNTKRISEENPQRYLAEGMFGKDGPDGMIGRMEKEGQEQLVASKNILPVEGLDDAEIAFEQYGFKKGEPVEGDAIFCNVTLPQGWEIRATEHDMWTELFDDKGRKRAAIFYKAAFYDRSAHMQLERAVNYPSEYAESHEGIAVQILKHEKLIHRIPYSSNPDYDEYTKSKLARDEAEKWLKENYPKHMDPTEYWD